MENYFDPLILDSMKDELNKHQTVIDGIIAGKSYRTIGAEVGIAPSTVHYFKSLHFPDAPSLKPDGEKTRKQREHIESSRAKRANRNNLIKQYLPTMSYREIATKVGCSVGTVGNIANSIP